MKKYESIYDRYKGRIAAGSIAAGERLPSIRDEARASGVSINTVISAYARLADEGWIRARERGGYYARSRAFIGTGQAVPAGRYVTEARAAGERLDQIFESLTRTDASFAVASPGTDLLPMERLSRALRRLQSSWIEYSDPAGDRELRRRIALVSEEHEAPTKSGDIVVTNGATEANALVFRTTLRAGDTVVIESPTYFNFFSQLAPLGVNIIEIPVGSDGMDLEILERELKTRKTRAVLVQPNVQNPTGITMSDGAKARLVAIAANHHVLLIQDDVYGDLHFGAERPRNLSRFGDYPGIVTVSSYSKSIAPGLRIGWIRSESLAKSLAEEKLRASFESCRAAQFALADFIGTADHRRHLAAIRRELERRIDAHIALLETILPKGSSVRRPSGGCLLWIAFPPDTDTTDVFQRSAGKGLIAAPGELFSSNPFFRSHLRINAGYALTPERETALRCLGSVR